MKKQRREEESGERSYNCARVSRKKINRREMLGKSRNAVFFAMICVSAGSKSRLAKAAGAEVAVSRTHEKLHAAVVRSTSSSQNVQNTSAADCSLKFICRKIARRCSEKHICKSKCRKQSPSEHFWTLGCGKLARRCSEKHICKSKC